MAVYGSMTVFVIVTLNEAVVAGKAPLYAPWIVSIKV